jgi:hypothetical protein
MRHVLWNSTQQEMFVAYTEAKEDPGKDGFVKRRIFAEELADHRS